LIKTHKEDKHIRPVVNNIQAPSYKLAKHLNKKLNQVISLTYTYKNGKGKVIPLQAWRGPEGG